MTEEEIWLAWAREHADEMAAAETDFFIELKRRLSDPVSIGTENVVRAGINRKF